MTTVQKSIIFLVLYVAICLMTASTLKLPDFECDPDGNVKLKNDEDVNKTEIVKADGYLCKPQSRALKSECGQTGSKSIQIIYGAPVIPANKDQLVGGKNAKYGILSCEEKPFEAVASAKPFVVSTPVVITKKIIPIKYAIKLSITDSLTHPNGPLLGDILTLLLEGPDGKHSLQPTLCKAFPTGHSETEHVIWNITNPAGGDCFNEPSVIEQKWTAQTNKTKLNIEMYAFRFATSSSVTIECSAYVCPLTDTSPECTEKCIAAHRRRRAIHGIQTSPKLNATSTKIMVASTSFQVQLGDQNTENSAARLSKNVQLYSVASIFVLIVTMMIR